MLLEATEAMHLRIAMLLCALGIAFAPTDLRAATRRFALIIANNHSLDPNLQSLSFADDDGAKYHELFDAMGAHVELFTVLDAAAQRRFPDATRAAQAPRGDRVWPSLDAMFTEIAAANAAGDETVFYFVYAGHGSIGANREGYLHLLDQKLPRSELYARVVQRSPATWNHLIIDACNAYFVVEKRGGDATPDYRAAVQRFLRSEDLRSYPNTGVILAASSESTTHEWSRWGAGVFSHQLRSALLGGADVDGDGAVTYAEAAYAVEAANAEVPDAAARLRVYARPPPLQVQAPLVNVNDVAGQHVELDPHLRGHHHVSDARGLRVLDVHPDGDGDRRLALLGTPPFVLTGPEGEQELPNEPQVRLTELAAVITSSERGLEQSYRRYLFARPFGKSFLAGALSVRGADGKEWDGWYGSGWVLDVPMLTLDQSEPAMAPLYAGALGSASAAVVAGVLSGVMYHLAGQSYAAYQTASTPSEIQALRIRSQTEYAASYGLLGVGIAAALGAGVMALIEWTTTDAPE